MGRRVLVAGDLASAVVRPFEQSVPCEPRTTWWTSSTRPIRKVRRFAPGARRDRARRGRAHDRVARRLTGSGRRACLRAAMGDYKLSHSIPAGSFWRRAARVDRAAGGERARQLGAGAPVAGLASRPAARRRPESCTRACCRTASCRVRTRLTTANRPPRRPSRIMFARLPDPAAATRE